MKKLSKILSIILAILMVISIFPITASAVSPTSGTCGDNLTWTYDSSTCTLTISGTGAMYDYVYNNHQWGSYEEIIETVVISNGVTSIGDYAFRDCTSLTSITIPDGVTTIGRSAFYGCSSLTSITIPDGVTIIGGYAFYGCRSLTSVTIPDTVTTIGISAFEDCSRLTSITIPDGVTTIGYSAFFGCSSLTSITIPDGVTIIGGYAFANCRSLTSITIPDGVTTISEGVFYQCTSLTSISIPDSVTTIGDYVFYNCTSLTIITIPDGVTTIGNSAFYGCSSLTSITIPDGVTTIGDDLFSNCYSLTSITIPDGVTTIGDGAFMRCYSLTSVTIPDTVTTIIERVFYQCTSLTSISIPDGVTIIGGYAFVNCTSLTSITIPDSVTTIGYKAFYSCDNLTDVYYCGTEEEWNSISIDDNNVELLNANIHYNYVPPFTGIKDNHFYKDDVMQKAYQLVEFEGDFYYIGDRHQIVKNKTVYLREERINGLTYADGTPIAAGSYDFDENGKMVILNGIVGNNIYKNNTKLKAYQLVEVDGDFYYIGDRHEIVKNKSVYLKEERINGLTYTDGTPITAGYYSFDENGKMIILNGLVGNNIYKNNAKLIAYQLVEVDGDFYYIGDRHEIVKNKSVYLKEERINGLTYEDGTPITAGYYNFDENGKMVILNGLVGNHIYKNNTQLKAYQLVEVDGDFYFIGDRHEIVKDKKVYLTEERINGLNFADGTPIAVGYYYVDADGKLIIE